MRSPAARQARRDRRADSTARLLVVAIVVAVLVGAAALMIVRRNADGAAPAAGSATKPVELSNPAPSMAELEGIWSRDDSRSLLRFGDDGTYALDDGGRLLADPDESGTYSVYGSTLTLVAENSRHCDRGQPWEWQVELLGDGRLHGIVTTAECLGRPVDWIWTRVSPDSRIDTTAPPTADAE